MIIHVILERNPELVFQDVTAVDLDKVYLLSIFFKIVKEP